MQSKTNQKLFFAQSQLESLSSTLENPLLPRDQLFTRGLADACVYQLMAVWHSLLQEVLANYKVRPLVSESYIGPGMTADCIDICQQQGTVSPELNYALKLETNGQSCLGLLLTLFDKALIGAPDQGLSVENEVGQNAENRIAIEQLGATESLQQQCQQLVHILKELEALIQHCRQTMQEY